MKFIEGARNWRSILGTQPSDRRGILAIARVHRRQAAQSAERKLGCHWPIRPEVFCHKKMDTKMPVGKSLTGAQQWHRSGTH